MKPRSRFILLLLFAILAQILIGEKVSNNEISSAKRIRGKLKKVVRKTPPSLLLTGRWKENQYRRSGLNDFLYQIGMNWFKRFYVTAVSWEDEQTIYQNGKIFRVNGFKGPQEEVYAYTLTADNRTLTLINMGENYGLMEGPSFIDDDKQSLVTELRKRGSDIEDDPEIIITRTRNKGSNTMVISTKHVPSNTVLTSAFNKI